MGPLVASQQGGIRKGLQDVWLLADFEEGLRKQGFALAWIL